MTKVTPAGVAVALLALGCHQTPAPPAGPHPDVLPTAENAAAAATAGDSRAPSPSTSAKPITTGSGAAVAPHKLADERTFWRFAPEHGGGYFKRLDGGKWEEIGR